MFSLFPVDSIVVGGCNVAIVVFPPVRSFSVKAVGGCCFFRCFGCFWSRLPEIVLGCFVIFRLMS